MVVREEVAASRYPLAMPRRVPAAMFRSPPVRRRQDAVVALPSTQARAQARQVVIYLYRAAQARRVQVVRCLCLPVRVRLAVQLR